MAARTQRHEVDIYDDSADVRRDPRAHDLLAQYIATPPGHPSRARLREQVIEAWLPLAHALARRYDGRGEPLDDIDQTACVGLIKAIDRFEPGRGSGFVAFAVPTVLGEIRRHFRDHTWELRVPRRLQEMRLAIREATQGLEQELGRSPTSTELASDLDTSRGEVEEAMRVGGAYATLSLDASVSATAEVDLRLGDVVGEDDHDLALAELRMALAPELARLPEREQTILRLRFYGNLSQTEIADRIGISQMHVSRLLARSLRLLRQALTGPGPQPEG
jgi:RNA polymerase sigma-B factor